MQAAIFLEEFLFVCFLQCTVDFRLSLETVSFVMILLCITECHSWSNSYPAIFGVTQTDRDTDKNRETETERRRQTDRDTDKNRETETERRRQTDRDTETKAELHRESDGLIFSAQG